MRLLLDTNALIWAVAADPRLAKEAQGLIADRDNAVLFSVVSIWEILIKVRVGKLHLDWRKLTGAAGQAGFQRIGVDIAHMETLAALPFYHRDPYDHLILAQAITEGASLVTSDANMGLYDVPIIACG